MRCETPSRKIHVEFGEVETGVTAVRRMEIVNESCLEQSYEARRDATTNPLDHVFELCSYSWTLSPGQVHKCKIYYRPFVPFSVNVDYFTIVNSIGERMEIRVLGTCIGPIVAFSTTRLVMICTSECPETRKRIKLVNDSKVAATFMFDVDRVQESFTVDTRHGRIGPHSRRCVTITFAPRKVGVHACRLPCLILNHRPIIIELYGYCDSTSYEADIQSRFNYPARSRGGFEEYTSDTVVAAQELPEISLSKNYIDFGQASAQAENAAQRIPETLCLTNHSPFVVLIKWEQDVDRIFSITPVAARVPASQTALFEVAFNPNRTSDLFARELVGFVFSEQRNDHSHEEMIVFPIITSVRLIGHSFPACSDSWIPQCEIPHIVRMPPCIPSVPVYSTFVIKRFGHLPLMYRFVPPTPSHFVVKPMMGIIDQDYQIVVVGMLPGTDNERVYVERWAVRFNGNMKSECYVDFRGFAQHADVAFNDGNVVRFAPCLIGCRQPLRFTMRNITRHTIKYEFVDIAPELQARSVSGKICSNDIAVHEWEFCSTIIGDYEFDVNCILIVLQNNAPVGPGVRVTLRATARCQMGFLVSMPDELNFGVQAYKATRELSLRVFNSSPVSIYYKMTCSHCNWPTGDIERDVKIRPAVDVVPAGQNKTIAVSITPTTPGYYELFIQYSARISAHADAQIASYASRKICKLNCLCVLPTLKVKDLQYCGPCSGLSKALLWKLMKMNRFNMLLGNLPPETSETLRMNIPAMVLHRCPVVVRLLLTNATAIVASWNVKRVQLCSCRLVTRAHGLSFQRSRHDCPHREVCSVQPRMGNLKPGEEAWIILELRYVLLGKTEAKWDLDLGDDRHIFLIMTIESLSGSENKLHLLNGTHFRFQHVYIGDKNPVYQVCWVYNATNKSVPFFVNCRTTREINKNYCQELFSCATPRGIINPRAFAPIFLKFQPRQFGSFEGKLSIALGDGTEELTLEGDSSLPHRLETVGEYVPFGFSSKIDDIPIYFSTDFFDISHIATHSHVMKMLIMYNNSKQDVLAYEWKRYEILETVCVDVYPQKGLIKPMAIQSFRVTVNTDCNPCVIDVNVPCKFINTSQRRAYQRSVYRHDDLSRELEEQFAITEKGVSIFKPSTKILEKPRPFYRTITIRCSTYSPENKRLKVKLTKELASAPRNGIYLEQDESPTTTFTKEDIDRSSFILEGLLWEIVNSELFQSLTQDILRDKLNLFYLQFAMNLYQRKRLIRRSYISPPRALINQILERMLFVIIHDEFALETGHLIQHTDIRHTGYLNMVSGMNRTKTQREAHLLHKGRDYSDYTEPKLPPPSKISFFVDN